MRLLAIGLTLVALVALPAWSDSRPPIPIQQVKNPQDWLSMWGERIVVTIDRDHAHVAAYLSYHTRRPLSRTQLSMRLGFPELAADPPLRNLTVRQTQHSYPATPGLEPAFDPVSETAPPQSGLVREPGDGGVPGVAAWYRWPINLTNQVAAPRNEAVYLLITYDQNLAPTPEERSLRFSYALHSASPWVDPIDHAVVSITLQHARVLSHNLRMLEDNAGVMWEMAGFKPTTDLVVTIRPEP